MAKGAAVWFIALQWGIVSETSMTSDTVILVHADMSVRFRWARVEFDVSCSE